MRVYKYGLPWLLDEEEAPDGAKGGRMAVERQLRAAHVYQNKLIELIRARRLVHRDAVMGYGRVAELHKQVDDINELYQDARDDLKKTRQKERRRAESDRQKAMVAKLRELYKESLAQLYKERRKAFRDSAVKELCKEADESFYEQQRQERTRDLTDEERQRGWERPFWGTKQIVEASVKQAHESMPLWDGVRPNDPRFRSWDGSGILGVQNQRPLFSTLNDEQQMDPAVQDIFGKDTSLRVDPVDPEAWHNPKRCERKRKSRTVLWMRVGSDENRQPVWACWRMIMHRPLPDGAQIKRASVSKRIVGERQKWTVQIYVDDQGCKRAPSCGDGSVTIDLGWRQQQNGVRIATWLGSDGRQGKFKLPQKVIERMFSERGIRKTRDENLDRMRPCLEAWIRNQKCLPEWLEKRTKMIGRWRSHARFRALAQYWRGCRFPGDEEGYDMLEAWRYRDHHLWNYERGRSMKSRGWRDQLYCQFGAWLARQYGTVVWENFNIAKMAKRPKLGDDYENERARAMRHAVAVATFRDKVENAFDTRGGRSRYVSAVNTTRRCHVCGLVDAFDAASSVKRVPPCPGCGASWDQDENACVNMMETYDRGDSSSKPRKTNGARNGKKTNGNAVEGESHWARMKRLKREKDAHK